MTQSFEFWFADRVEARATVGAVLVAEFGPTMRRLEVEAVAAHRDNAEHALLQRIRRSGRSVSKDGFLRAVDASVLTPTELVTLVLTCTYCEVYAATEASPFLVFSDGASSIDGLLDADGARRLRSAADQAGVADLLCLRADDDPGEPRRVTDPFSFVRRVARRVGSLKGRRAAGGGARRGPDGGLVP